jgi:hypothetical protein
MTSYQIWNYIGVGSFVISVIFLAIALLLFFRGHIPSVIAVLTGRAQKKDIERIQVSIGEGGNTGKFDFFEATDGWTKGNETKPLKASSPTVKDLSLTENSNQTELLDDNSETELLLQKTDEETTLLGGVSSGADVGFRIVRSETEVHSNESMN